MPLTQEKDAMVLTTTEGTRLVFPFPTAVKDGSRPSRFRNDKPWRRSGTRRYPANGSRP